jgi:hypothetical protein
MTFRTWALILLIACAVSAAAQTPSAHPDFVPDEKTAQCIAEAVLVARYGEERVNAQLPLLVNGSDKDYWRVEGSWPEHNRHGGNFGVWINKHSGAIGKMIERLK